MYNQWNMCGCDCKNLTQGIELFWQVGFNSDGGTGHTTLWKMMGESTTSEALQIWEAYSLDGFVERLVEKAEMRPFLDVC